MDIVLTWLIAYEYAAMVLILTLCGVGLPLPEELTLISAGLLVGWHEADFWLASLCCAAGILAGDSLIFGLGHRYGGHFLHSRFMHRLLKPARQGKIQQFFELHGSKALFFARFFPGVRIGVYAYAGSQRLPWLRFAWLDGLGVLLSAPLSIAVGAWAARTFADDRKTAVQKAIEMGHRVGHWVLALVVGLAAISFLAQYLVRRHTRKPKVSPTPRS